MDYKEKYEMALEGIQEILSSGEDSIKMSKLQLHLQGVFPELKESEDERIRKSLIHLVHLYGGEFGMIDANTSVEKAIAGLEKQGEQIPANSCQTCKDVQKPQRMVSAEAKEAMYDKPAWSEEDERILDALITSLNNEVFAGRLERLKGIGVSLVIDWLKSIKTKSILQL